MKTCICDKCNTEIGFDIRKEVIDRDKNGEEIIEQFFICQKCGARYTIFISDQFMRKKIAARKRLKRTAEHYNPALDTALVKEMQRHFKKLKKRYNK